MWVVGGRELLCEKSVVEDGGGWCVERGGGTEEKKGVSWDVKICFSTNELKLDATAGVQADFRQR